VSDSSRRVEAVRPPTAVEVRVPGDKSLTHRGVLLGLLAAGTTRVEEPLQAWDTERSVALAEAFGARVTREDGAWVVESPGLGRLQEPDQVVDCGNSGTTMRLGAGIAATVDGLTILTGDASLRRRPMDRVLDPLSAMGVAGGARSNGRPPLWIRGGRPASARHRLAVASAQVKSALLLAGLAADGPVEVEEPAPSRDHTERLLAAMGIQMARDGVRVRVEPGVPRPIRIRIPGDPSAAAFWWAWAALAACRVVTDQVLLNPTRTGFLRVLERMGVAVRQVVTTEVPEPVGRVEVEGQGTLTAVTVDPSEVPALIDELPLVALLATQARGRSVVVGAAELRVKESDRIRAMGDGLRRLGGRVEDQPDGWVVEGPTALHGTDVDSFGDHRIAMAFMVAAAATRGPVTVAGADQVAVSYPGFAEALAASGLARVSDVT
jgi:3-phosphoshikimate 1-carboxyvinyltransferase